MNDSRTPLQTLEAFEAAAWRLSQTVRNLLTEYPHLPLDEIRTRATAAPRIGGQGEVAIELPGDIDAEAGVRTWAQALGTPVDTDFFDSPGAFLHWETRCVTADDITIVVRGTRSLTPEEADARRDAAAGAESEAS